MPGEKAKPMPRRDTVPMQFLQLLLDYNFNGCVNWPFGIATETGYGKIHVDGKACNAARVMCEMQHGPPPEIGMHAAHGCGNRPCVNPKHLRWATPTENAADMIEHGTLQIGEKHPRARLTEAQALAIKTSTKSYRTLAREFGCSFATVASIRTGRNWGWLKCK